MRSHAASSILGMVLAVALGGAARAQDWGCSPWEWVHPAPFPLHLSTAVTVGGTFWAFGETGAAVSRDGLVWQRKSMVSGELSAVMWTGSEFLGTAANTIVASSDGVRWAVRHEVWQDPIFFTIDLRSIASSGSRYVAVGEDYSGRYYMWSPVLLSSPDGVVWSRPEFPTAADPSHSSLSAVIWAKGRFVAVGSYLLTSPDGTTWAKDEAIHGSSLASDGDLVVVADDDGLSLSRDLATWETVASPVTDARIAFVGGRFWLAGRCDACPDREPSLWSSGDAKVWQRASLDAPIALRAFTTDGQRIVAVGWGTAVSVDGESWQTSNAQLAAGLGDLAWSGTRYAAVGESGELLTSEDGTRWRRVLWGGATRLSSVTWGPVGFVVVGEGVALTSAAGVVWTSHSLPGGVGLRKVVSNGSRYLGIGWSDVAFWSADGVTWTPVDLSSLALGRFFYNEAVAGGGVFVVSVWRNDGGGAVLTSPDGVTWQRGVDTTTGLAGLGWGGGRFLATDFAKVLASTNGATWQEVYSGVELVGLLWVGDRFVASSRSGGFYSSADGSEWATTAGPGEAGTLAAGSVLWKAAGDGSVRRAVCGVPSTTVDLPSLAHLPGAQGTQWRSDLELHNPGTGAVSFGLVGTVRGQVGVGSQLTLTLAGGKALRLDDVLASWLGIEDAATVRLASWGGPALAVGRTYDETPAGTYGQLITPYAPSSAVESGGEARLIQLAHAADRSSGFRTNVGLVNTGSHSGEVDVELWRGDGTQLGTQVATLRVGESVQLNDIFRSVTSADVGDAYAIVKPAGTGVRALVYASVVDNLSGDPVFVRPAKIVPTGQPVWLPGAGHLPGLAGSVWRTDLEIHNPGPQEASCLIDLFPWDRSGGPWATATVTVPSGESVRIADVVGQRLSYQGGASLRLTPTAGAVMASARTYAVAAAGSFGQYVSAMEERDAISTEAPRRLIMLRQSASGSQGFRSNIGLVNVTELPAEVDVELHDASGALLGTMSRALGAFESVQVTAVLRTLVAQPVDDAYAIVRVATAGAKVLAYACLIDNRTNDPVFMTTAQQ